MGTFTTVLLIVLGISFAVFVIFFGRLPALRHTPIAWLNKLILVHVPNGVLALDKVLTGGRFTSSLYRCGTAVVYDRHPTVLIFYILLLSVSEYLYLPSAWPLLDPVNKAGAVLACFFPYFFLYLAAFGDPGYITAENHGYHMQLYPYDYTLYHPGVECRTCRLPKPPRSKHCSVCKRCVGRMDHHCIFINKCVGYGNHHYFILLLVSTAVLASYGAVLGIEVLAALTRTEYPAWSVWKPRGMSWNDYLVVWGWGVQDRVGMAAVTLLTAMISPMVWGLLAYTLYLVACGTTTNESMKWSDWRAEAQDGCAFRRRMSPNRRRFAAVEPPHSRWPLETEQILIQRDDGQPPPPDVPYPGEGEWRRLWNMSDVDNLYHLGFRENLADIFVPNKNFNDGTLPHMLKKRPAKLMPC